LSWLAIGEVFQPYLLVPFSKTDHGAALDGIVAPAA
jgi:hypothetical protein